MKFRNKLGLSFFLFTMSFIFVCNISAKVSNDLGIYASVYSDMQVPNTITHTVAKGETVYSIAANYNTTVQAIYKLNPKAEKGIKAGDKLKVQKVRKATTYSSHLIDTKETMYSVSRMYHVSVDELKDANPGLDESNFSRGKTIRIPQYTNVTPKTTSDTKGYGNPNGQYIVQKGETLYSIGRSKGVSVEALLEMNPSLKISGLKEGMAINLPGKQIQPAVKPTVSESKITREDIPYASRGEIVRVGVLFPFLDESASIPTDKLAEYYEGFLLALKELKGKGLNAEVYTFDTGSEKNTKKLESLLGTNEVKNLHLIIGGTSKQQIDLLTKFSKKTGIKYVIPFGTTKEIESVPGLYQATTSHSNLYKEIIAGFKKKYSGYNVVLVSDANSDKSDFIDELKKELTKSDIRYKTAASTSVADIQALLDAGSKNVLIPLSSSEASLKRVLLAMNSMSVNTVTLFGYPEWQTYLQEAAELHKYGASIYSIFFLNDKQGEVKSFATEYKKWYNKNLINSYPKYGCLGYDTGLYFLTALNRYGSHFEDNISNVIVPTLQSAIHFERENSKGGFVNKGVYLIQYKTDQTIEKSDISR